MSQFSLHLFLFFFYAGNLYMFLLNSSSMWRALNSSRNNINVVKILMLFKVSLLVKHWDSKLSVRMSVCHTFLIFQKRGFEIVNINFSNTTKLLLLDSLLQEVTIEEIQIATCLIWQSLFCLIHFSKSLPWGLCRYVSV